MFDEYIMVDWSSHSEPKADKDSVWIGHGGPLPQAIRVSNPSTRDAAYILVHDLLTVAVAERRKVLLGFDFPYGYPAGLAAAIGLPAGANSLPQWLAIWNVLHGHMYGVGGGDINNGVSKFAMANALNHQYNISHGNPLPVIQGPFWGREDWTCTNNVLTQLPPNVRNAPPFVRGQRRKGAEQRRAILAGRGIEPANFPYLAMTSPGFPLNGLECKRIVEKRAKGSQEAWKVNGVGSVGGQALTGIPYLHRLYIDSAFHPISKVWPFTTNFVDPTEGVCGPLIVHAEIFPSVLNPDPTIIPANIPAIPDARQVWTLVDYARRLDAQGILTNEFAEPGDLTASEIHTVCHDEGWILFA